MKKEHRNYFGIPTFFCVAFLFISCSKVTPGGFWGTFQKDLLVKNISDQGPQGGSRAMYWKTERQNVFNRDAVLDFALKHDWVLTGSSHFTADSLRKWADSGKDIFPLSDRGFSPSERGNGTFKKFPRWITSNATLYKFRTGWLLYEAGTDMSTEENGFIIINDIGTGMSVYHFWGE